MVQRHLVLPTRREFLDRACRCSAGLAALALLPSCATESELPGPRLRRSELPDGARVIVMDGSVPIEISREGEQVYARSLLCTHQGCEVSWNSESAQYMCPCHEGVFNHSGDPVMGPPREPLRRFAVEQSDGYLQVDTRAPLESR
jgi:Rieske Fe-S protein